MNDISEDEWSEREAAGAAKSLRKRMCAPEQLAPFLQRDSRKLFGILLFDYLSILCVAAVAIQYPHPLMYAIALLWIGGRQIGIGSIALHDGAHGMLLKNRRHNDWLARALLWSIFAPAFTLTLDGYRATHFHHHREVNSSGDPDLGVTQFSCGSRKNVLLLLLASLTGLVALYLFTLYLRSGGWRRRSLALLAVAGLITGLVMTWVPVKFFFLYYMVPALTWGMFINQVRVMAEHYSRGQFDRDRGIPDVLLTRDVLPTWFDRGFVTTRAVNYHLTHHLFPAVPFYHLGQLQRCLGRSDAYRECAHVTHGYHRFLGELFTRKRA